MVQPGASHKKNQKTSYSYTKTEISRSFLYFIPGQKSLKNFIFHETSWDFNEKSHKNKNLLFHGYT